MSLSKVITTVPARSLVSQGSVLHKGRQLFQCLTGQHNLSGYVAVLGVSPRWVHTGGARHGITDPENVGSSQRGVNFDTLGVWNNRLDMPIMVEKSIEKGRLIPRIPMELIGNATLLGRRKVNEDRMAFAELAPDLLFFGIFDGHGGTMAVDFVNENIQDHIKYWMTRTKDLETVLQNSFNGINNLLTRHIVHYHLDTEQQMAGTTATVCLLRNNIELVVGHVGDTRAILCREGTAIRLTEDHDPENPEERARIKKYGGCVTENSLGVAQVNGRLAMTRSIGDIELKAYGVTAEPYIRSIEVRHGKDAFMVLLSDGVSFVLSDQETVDIIGSCKSPSEGSAYITDQALQFGSEDNSSAMVIPFGAWGKYRGTTRSIPYSFARNLSNRY